MTAPPDMEKLYKDLSVAFWSGPLRSDEYERYLVRSAYAAGAAAERERCKGLVALASSPTVRDRSWICSPRAVVESFDAVEPAAPTATAEPTSTWQRVNGQWQCQECGTLRDFRPPDPCDFCSDAKQPEPARPLTLDHQGRSIMCAAYGMIQSFDLDCMCPHCVKTRRHLHDKHLGPVNR